MFLLAVLALPLAAQQPRIQNGQLSVVSTSSLATEIDVLKGKNETSWVAYTVPTPHRMQNSWNPDRVDYLEEGHNHTGTEEQPDTTKESDRALLLLRIADHVVQAVRVEDPERKLDAGGTHVEFLPDVEPTQSISVLQSLAEGPGSRKLRDTAIFAISMHGSPATVPALTALGSANHDLSIRERAAFWLSAQHDKEALPILDGWIRNDKDDRFREKLAFDLSLIHQPASADILIRTAHKDAVPQVRKQAQFWMANLATKEVIGSLSEAAGSDPDEGVRKSAVFSLSRLPNGEGTPRLIELAQTSNDRDVRKQAVFWLGQSSDPRVGIPYAARQTMSGIQDSSNDTRSGVRACSPAHTYAGE